VPLAAAGQTSIWRHWPSASACSFDTFDGRVARLTKTQTDLGRDLDSLADVITFGAAPALLVYKWGLTDFGFTGIFVAGLFVCAGAMRLARFNVLSRRDEISGHKKPASSPWDCPSRPPPACWCSWSSSATTAASTTDQRELHRRHRADSVLPDGLARALPLVQRAAP
jgi:hypothetical protein